MAKRFIQHEVLRNPWLRVAQPLEKLLWIGLITECDHAGIWIVDWPMMELMIGGKIDPAAAKKFLQGRFIEIDNGRRWFLPDFIRFQYSGGVAANNNTMKSVRQILDKHYINHDTLTIDQPFVNPSSTLDQGLQDKDKDKDRDKDSVLRAHEAVPRLLETTHRGKVVDWYESQLVEATEVSTPIMKKLLSDLNSVPGRYQNRLSTYKELVGLMVNGDPVGCDGGMHDTVLMLKKQLKFIEYSKLADLSKSPAPIRDVIMAMHNSYIKSVKGKTTVYETALDWLKRRLGNQPVNGHLQQPLVAQKPITREYNS
jgi:hypothetical protein